MTGIDRTQSDALVYNRDAGIERLLEIMMRLRAPDGCPWDREQTWASIAPYTIEEACEVADAIERGNVRDLTEELGDLLLQVVYHERIAEESGDFAFNDVIRAIRIQIDASTIDVVTDNGVDEPITRTFSQTISLRNLG